MKKIILLLLVTAVALAGCKKEKTSKEKDVVLEKKYARYAIRVYQDREMTKWLATLSKTEPVDLLGTSEIMIKNKKITLAEVKLSDDKKGFMNASNLADRPVVFTADTKAHVRNNTGSMVAGTIPRGHIGFITAEKGEWVQIYAGKINGKWITRHWVKSGFSGDENLVLEARTYEESKAVLDNENASEEKRKEAKEKLKDLEGSSTSFFKELAAEALNKPEQEKKKDETPDTGDNETREEEKPEEM